MDVLSMLMSHRMAKRIKLFIMKVFTLRLSRPDFQNEVIILFRKKEDAIAEFEHKANQLNLKKVAYDFAYIDNIELSIIEKQVN